MRVRGVRQVKRAGKKSCLSHKICRFFEVLVSVAVGTAPYRKKIKFCIIFIS